MRRGKVQTKPPPPSDRLVCPAGRQGRGSQSAARLAVTSRHASRPSQSQRGWPAGRVLLLTSPPAPATPPLHPSSFLPCLPLLPPLSPLHYKDGRMFKYAHDYMQGMCVWQSYTDDFVSPTHVKLQKGRSTTYKRDIFDLSTVVLPLKYPDGVRLKKEKLADLQFLLSYIPIGHRSWFEELFQAQGVENGPAPEDDPDDPDHIEDDVLDYH